MATKEYFGTKDDINRRLVIAKHNEVYAEEFKQGYEWRTNCLASDAEGFKERFEEEGLEVIVHDKAFDFSGTEDLNMKALLVKKKK